MTAEQLQLVESAARERLAVLAEASETLASSLDWDTTLENVIGLTMPLLADFGFFDVVEGERVRRIARAWRDPRRQHLLAGTQWVRSERRDMNLCALSTGESGLHPHIDDEWLRKVAVSPEHLAVMRDLGFCSMLTVPLPYQGRCLGALTLFFADSRRHHTPTDLALAEELARRAAAAVENARLFQEAQSAVRQRDDFLSVASHELRTPLSTLRLQADALARLVERGGELSAERVAAGVQRIQRQVGRLDEMVRSLLDLSRLAEKTLRLEREVVDLAELAREVTARFAEQLEQASCPLDLDAETAVVGRWDRLALDQVVSNLLGNALKFGRGDRVEVRVDGDAEWARLVVRDHGVGIAVEDQERIFGRYERGSAHQSYGGFGLGLWISRRIVEALGGRVELESRPGEGATFTVILPRNAG